MEQGHSNSPDGVHTSLIEGDYSHIRPRRLSMHRNATSKTLRSGASYNDWNYTVCANREATPEHVDAIVEKIVKKEECLLGEGIVAGMDFRQDTLRNMPQSLTMKKLVKEKLLFRNVKAKKISLWKQIKFQLSLSSKKCITRFQDFFHTTEFWNGTMKKIEGEFGSATAIYFRFFRHLFRLNCVTFVLCFLFIALPEIIQSVSVGHRNPQRFDVLDLFTGQGYLESSVLFYGYYHNYTIQVANNLSYSMPRAYFYTMIVVYVFLLAVLAVSMMRSYRINFIETKGGLKNVFAHKVFCTWDFGIATERAAKLKSSAIFHEFKELLEKELRSERKSSCKSTFFTFMLRLTTHLLFLGVVGAIGYAIWLMLEVHWVDNNSEWDGIFTAIIINAVIYLVPVMFSFISRYEDYDNPRKRFKITLLRTLVLHAAIIGIVVGFWLFQAHKISGCWETKLGQEMYRLLIVEFVFSIGFFICKKVLQCTWAVFTHSKIEGNEFEIAEHTVHLIYNQALFWLGLLFAPLLGAVIVAKYLVMWYFSTVIEIRLSKPTTKFWRATNTHTWFLVITFLSAVITMCGLGCIMAFVYASKCGPFGSTRKKYIYDFLKDEILRMERGVMVWQVLAYLLKPGVVALVIIVMMGFIYYLRERALAQEKMVSLLREMIVQESKDKEFLIKQCRIVESQLKSAEIPESLPESPQYRQQQNQTEFQRNQETVIPVRADDSTSMSSIEQWPDQNKLKHQ